MDRPVLVHDDVHAIAFDPGPDMVLNDRVILPEDGLSFAFSVVQGIRTSVIHSDVMDEYLRLLPEGMFEALHKASRGYHHEKKEEF